MNSIQNSLLSAKDALDTLIEDSNTVLFLDKVTQLIVNTFNADGKIIVFGNGGSACDSMHFAEEFTGRFRKHRRALPVISLTDASHITCVGNDYGFEDIFSRGVEAFGKDKDIVMGISTSGNSKNVINGISKASELNLSSVSLLGKDGGIMKGMCSYEMIAPGATTDRIQELHMLILHALIENVERTMFPELY